MDATLTGSGNERGLASESEDGSAYLVQVTSGERVCDPEVIPMVGSCRIGRRSEEVSVGLMLDDGRASRLHAELRKTDGGWLLTDLGSKNGTEVDGRRLTGPRAVHDRAVLRIGDTLFVLRTRRPANDGLVDDADLPGISPEMAEVRRAVRAVAPGQHPVLVLGPTGSGKEYAAWAIHRHAASSGPRVAVNVAELQPNLAAAELFGYEPGAYTGATASGADGLVTRADGGTLFLDEIGDLSLDVQPTLLRFLESGEYRRVGSGTVSRSRARIVAATHVDLDAAVAQQLFRRDLLGRLRA
jgi:transcriptional regulator of acetoin/glycerol metabolism